MVKNIMGNGRKSPGSVDHCRKEQKQGGKETLKGAATDKSAPSPGCTVVERGPPVDKAYDDPGGIFTSPD
jgi:hypothetical protein